MAHRIVSGVILMASIAAWCPVASASVGRTAEGIWYSVGGIGEDESDQFAADSEHHALSVRFAARGSGAYLPDVALRIVDDQQRTVFAGRLDGPWLLMDLPAGRYELVGTYEGEVSRLDVVVPAHGRRSAVMYFPVEGLARPFRGDAQ
jgi:hypothetical protein